MHVDNIISLPQQFRKKGIEVTCTGRKRRKSGKTKEEWWCEK